MSEPSAQARMAALDAKVAARLARMAAYEADRQAEIERRESARIPAEQIAPGVIGEMFAGLKLTPAAEFRRWQFENDVCDRLRAWNWESRFFYEMGEWKCQQQQHVFEKVCELFTGCGAIVALVGERGCGKTTIAAQLAIQQAWSNIAALDLVPTGRTKTVCYRKLNDLTAKYKSLYAGYGSLNTEDLIESRKWLTRETGVLVVDELHECGEVSVRDALLTDMLDRRYAALRDTLLISNQTEAEFNKAMPDSVLSRIDEHGMVIECDWPSWRGNPDAKSA